MVNAIAGSEICISLPSLTLLELRFICFVTRTHKLLFLYLLHIASTRWLSAAASRSPSLACRSFSGGVWPALPSSEYYACPELSRRELIRLPAYHRTFSFVVDTSYHRVLLRRSCRSPKFLFISLYTCHALLPRRSLHTLPKWCFGFDFHAVKNVVLRITH